jgi:hypothetical protein
MKKEVSVSADVYCRWSGSPPVYRLYVNHELFTERTWIWKDGFLTESFHVCGEPGDYPIRYEILTNGFASISVKNLHITHGQETAYIQDNILRITQ